MRPLHKADHPHFQILLICTGNLYRSPTAEYLLRDLLGETGGVKIASAGTRARPDQPIAPEMSALLTAYQIDAGGFRSRPLSDQSIREADLILGMEREHRSAVVTRIPGALNRSYTLKEFARLARTVPDEAIAAHARRVQPGARLALLVEEARAFRGAARPEDDDIADPIGRGDQVIEDVFAEIDSAVDTIARVALGRVPGRRGLVRPGGVTR